MLCLFIGTYQCALIEVTVLGLDKIKELVMYKDSKLYFLHSTVANFP